MGVIYLPFRHGSHSNPHFSFQPYIIHIVGSTHKSYINYFTLVKLNQPDLSYSKDKVGNLLANAGSHQVAN